jgi:hypothetical protein
MFTRLVKKAQYAYFAEWLWQSPQIKLSVCFFWTIYFSKKLKQSLNKHPLNLSTTIAFSYLFSFFQDLKKKRFS